ncbi:HDIG domain-containing protein [bacterium]|nr:HDIG domain-containing protein [bacterium]
MGSLRETNDELNVRLIKEFKKLKFIMEKSSENEDEDIFRWRFGKFEKPYKIYDSWQKKRESSPQIFVWFVFSVIFYYVTLLERFDDFSEKYVGWLRQKDTKSRFIIFFVFTVFIAWLLIPDSGKESYPVEEKNIGHIIDHSIVADKDYTIINEEETAKNQERAQKDVPNTYDFVDQRKNLDALSEAFKMMREAAKENIKETIVAKNLPFPPEFHDILADYVINSGNNSDLREFKTGLPAVFMKKRGDFERIIGTPLSNHVFRDLSDNIFPARIPEAIAEISDYFNQNDYYILREGIPADYVPKHIVVKKKDSYSQEVSPDAIKINSLFVQTGKIINSVALKAEILHTKDKLNMSDFTDHGFEIVAEVGSWTMKDSIFYNAEITEYNKIEAKNNAQKSERKIVRGERVISSKAVITKEDIEVFKVMQEQSDNISGEHFFFGNFFYIAAFISIVFLVFTRSIGKFKYRNKDLLLMTLLMSVALFLLRYAMPWIQEVTIDNKAVYFFFPLPFFVAAVRVLVNTETACFFLFVLSAALTMLFPENYFIPVFYIFSSLTFMYIIFHVESSSQIMWQAFKFSIFAMGLALVVCMLDLSLNHSGIDVFKSILCAFVAAILSGGLLTIMIPLFESTLDYVTNIKYVGYSTMSNELIKQMSVYANGTYQHSLTVASLVEVAARELGLNPLKCKVMAYFHDIGKLERPEYFTENQRDKKNAHDSYRPTMSARIITNHVKYGLELAKKYHLGEEIESAIVEHHGTTLVGYFYKKAKEADPNVSEAEFKYAGPAPQSKETALLMIADSCEAAIRSLDKKTENGIKTRVQEIMAGKIKENQFVHCNLTTKDLQTIEDSLVNTFSGIYHGRVKYPQDKAKDQPAAADQKEQKEPKDQPAAADQKEQKEPKDQPAAPEQNAQPVAADQKEQETK